MKKSLLFILVSIIAAVVVGRCIARYRITHPPYSEQALIECITPSVPAFKNPMDNINAVLDGAKKYEALAQPILNVERLYNFGILQNGEVGKHQFVLKNTGTADLTVSVEETSCKCTAANLGNDTVKPGESTVIDVTWKTADYMGDYTQKVLIRTNDPDMMMVELEVRGKIVADARAMPSELTFANIPRGYTAQAQTKIACYKNPPLEITGYDYLNPDAKDRFELQIAPLTEEEYQSEPDATGGYGLTLTAKDNLPLGPFSETLVIKTSSPFQPEINVPIYGTVVGNISLAGPGWNEESKTWILGILESGTVGKKILWVLDRSIKAEDREKIKPGEVPPHIKLEIESVNPDWLQVELGESTYLPESGVVRTLIHLTIPADAPICDYWGHVQEKMGTIILKTSSEDEKSILINIRFAVKNKQE